ncbi:hypothetical protein IQ07DRAFT_646137 [Pyrenochaeta sp. DS3sAY3a]|nr:hypothetical protein IQ07DRAFT_646137 [Pyrenochaeta sp. DS3sAY3a]
MVRRTDPKDDAWENVKDAKKRKQIQDRLAQRARNGIGNASGQWDLDHDNGAQTNAVSLQYPSKANTMPDAIIFPLSQPNFPFTVFSALYINGEIQGIPCSTTYSARTPHPNPSIPLPLHPTDLQRLVVHPRWIDRLPFPKMRDTLIKLQGVLDEEALMRDLFTLSSWTIIPGQACWDPRAWHELKTH